MTEKGRSSDKITTTRTTTSSSTTTRAHTAGRVPPTPFEWEQIRQTYVDVLGALNCVKAHDIEEAVNQGVQPSAILDAIEQTALAPRPTHYYLRAVLRRYANWGIFTREAAEKDRNERKREQRLAQYRNECTWYGGQLYEEI